MRVSDYLQERQKVTQKDAGAKKEVASDRYGGGGGAGIRAALWKQTRTQGGRSGACRPQEGGGGSAERAAVGRRRGGYGLTETVMLKGWEERAKPLNEMAQAARPGKVPSTEPFIKVSLPPFSCPYLTGGSGWKS